MTVPGLLVLFLMYVLVPLWLAAGLADWLCHRAARIEQTSGFKESALHLVQFVLVGVPLLAALFLQVNAAVLLLMIVGLVLHQAVAIWDVRYANATRRVPPTEQHLHGVLEATPAVATAVVIMLHWQEFRGLLGRAPASFALELKHEPLPGWYLASILGATAIAGALPYAEEFVRCLRRTPR
jgi:hypothetical protein